LRPLARGAMQLPDLFRQLPRELTESTNVGGLCTLLAYGFMMVLAVFEVGSFFSSELVTDMVMDGNQDRLIQINFDITMHDLPCNHMKISVTDAFGEEKIDGVNKFHYIPIDHEGNYKGEVYQADEVAELEAQELLAEMTEDEKKALETDWLSSSDTFKHTDFDSVIAVHDFTLMNFYAEWCSHCREFHPTWQKSAEKISGKMKFKDADGQDFEVKMLKINCVDFQDTCTSAQVQAFPTVRLYKRDGSFSPFTAKRTMEDLTAFITEQVAKSHHVKAKHHHIFREGCHVQGTMEVPRVPGEFHLEVDGRGTNINPALTNVSHRVNHLSFGAVDGSLASKGSNLISMMPDVPDFVKPKLNPIDGREFISRQFHEAPQHAVKVVATTLQSGRVVYQLTHASRTAKLTSLEKGVRRGGRVPQAKFTYDLSPMGVVLRRKSKHWYELITALLAICGGAFTVFKVMYKGGVGFVSVVKEVAEKMD